MKTSEHIFLIFSKFERKKLRKTRFEVFVQGQKQNFGMKKKHGVGREISFLF
jgi:hypothetical protein